MSRPDGFRGDFHRLTCRSDRDLDEDSHTGYRLSRTSRRLLRAGRSYLGPKSKSIKDAFFLEPVNPPARDLDSFDSPVFFKQGDDVAEVVVSAANGNAKFLEFIPDFSCAEAVRMIRQNHSDRFCWAYPRIERCRFTFKGQVSVTNLRRIQTDRR